MAVQGSAKVPQQVPPVQSVQTDTQTHKPAAVAPASPQDQVQISPQARQAQSLASQLQAVPEVRTDRVAQVQQQVSAQAPNPPAAKVAEKLLLEG